MSKKKLNLGEIDLNNSINKILSQLDHNKPLSQNQNIIKNINNINSNKNQKPNLNLAG